MKLIESLTDDSQIKVGTIYTGSCQSSASDVPYRYFFKVIEINGNKVTLEGHRTWEKFPPFSGDGNIFTKEMNPDGSIDMPYFTMKPM